MTHRDAPIADRTAGLRFGDCGELLQGLRIPKRMQGPNRVLERLLRVRPAGDREIDLLDRLCPGVGARAGLHRQRKQHGDGESNRNSTLRHGKPPLAAFWARSSLRARAAELTLDGNYRKGSRP